MKTSDVVTLLSAKAIYAGVFLLALSCCAACVDGKQTRSTGGASAPVAASVAQAASEPLPVYIGYQAVTPSTGVIHHRLEPADGSIALARQAHQVPVLIVLGVAKGQARLVLEYGDGHTEVRALDVRAGSPADAQTFKLKVGELHTGQAGVHLKSFSAAMSGMVEVQVAPNGQDYLIRALKPGTTSVILIQDDGGIQQKLVEITP